MMTDRVMLFQARAMDATGRAVADMGSRVARSQISYRWRLLVNHVASLTTADDVATLMSMVEKRRARLSMVDWSVVMCTRRSRSNETKR